MTTAEIKKYLQEFMTEGLMLIVGSGVSCAEGLPGMGALQEAIDEHAAKQSDPDLQAEWEGLAALIPSAGLEGALKRQPPSEPLEALIKAAVSQAIITAEAKVIEDVICGKRVLPLGELLEWVEFGQSGLPILTTNYDRLVELACESSGIAVDTLFDGKFMGTLSSDRWRLEQLEGLTFDRQKPRPTYRKFAKVLKPHGSLDWWDAPKGPARHLGTLPLPRLIVTPGSSKYRAGYNEPFDTQRNAANAALGESERLLILGYGFNDDHLEATRLEPQIAKGKPTVIVALELTDTARSVVASAPKVTAIECLDPKKGVGTRIHHRGEVLELSGEGWWHLPSFVKEVLRP